MPDIAARAAQLPSPKSLTELLDEIDTLTEGRDTSLSLAAVLDAFGPRGALPVLILVALVVVSPLSGIPGLSSLAGLTIAGISLQLVAGRATLWLPRWLCDRHIAPGRLSAGIRRLRPLARFLDRHSRARLRVITVRPLSRLLYAICAVSGLAMPFLEFLPFTSSLLALAVVCMGFALLTRDGMWAVVAACPILVALGLIVTLIF